MSCKSAWTGLCQICKWGQQQITNYTVDTCLLTKSEGGLMQSFHDVDEDELHCLETTVTSTLEKYEWKFSYFLTGTRQQIHVYFNNRRSRHDENNDWCHFAAFPQTITVPGSHESQKCYIANNSTLSPINTGPLLTWRPRRLQAPTISVWNTTPTT